MTIKPKLVKRFPNSGAIMSFVLHVGDNVEVMRREIPDASIQLTVTSPPYDNLRKYNGYAWDFEAVARELYRVTKPGGVVVWVVADATINGSETGTSFRQALYFRDVCGFNLHDTMIYRKPSGANAGSLQAYRGCFEYMFVFCKGHITAFNLIRDTPNKSAGRTVTSTKRKEAGHTERFTHTIPGFSVRQNVWDMQGGYMLSTKDKEAFVHPAIFPEVLARDHILSWSNPGDTVLDPFVGSGTTGKMAVLNGREFIGIDISPEYVALANGRINGTSAGLVRDEAVKSMTEVL